MRFVNKSIGASFRLLSVRENPVRVIFGRRCFHLSAIFVFTSAFVYYIVLLRDHASFERARRKTSFGRSTFLTSDCGPVPTRFVPNHSPFCPIGTF
jgi:hypothetical protein